MRVRIITIFGMASLAVAGLAGCKPDYSPNTYASNAVQQANKVDRGVVIGVRQVDVTAAGAVGAATGAASGGIAGSQTPGGSVGSAFGAVGGALIGGLVGAGIEQSTTKTKAFEYIVRKPNGDLISVTQVDEAPLPVGQKVLVIAGNQARIVGDYTTDPTETAATPAPAVSVPKPEEPPAVPAPVTQTPLPDAPDSAIAPATTAAAPSLAAPVAAAVTAPPVAGSPSSGPIAIAPPVVPAPAAAAPIRAAIPSSAPVPP